VLSLDSVRKTYLFVYDNLDKSSEDFPNGNHAYRRSCGQSENAMAVRSTLVLVDKAYKGLVFSHRNDLWHANDV
jgi:hypothetical protein